jgi:predicted alpha/beta-fold hydrolase
LSCTSEALTPTPFRPYPLTSGGHRQTLLGYMLRRPLRWTRPADDVVVDAGGGVRLLVRASWQPGPREARPLVVLVHGLSGCDQSTHAVAAARHAWARGWHVWRMNMRGAGDSEEVCARLYNAGLDVDLLAVLREAGRQTPRVTVAGFSLGAGLTVLTAGRRAADLPAEVRAVAAVSPPLDLAACADALDRPVNRLYTANFLVDLCRAYRSRQRRLPELYRAGLERGLRTIRQYDDVITAPYGGYRDAADYYGQSSAGPYVSRLDRPTLLLAAEDDPMIPAESITRWPLPESGCVLREVLATGGHVGFVAPTAAPGRFWAAERVMDFLEGAVSA